MSRDPAEPSKHLAEPDVSAERQRLYDELGDETRAGQRATDIIDDLITELLGINRTDARCLDILDQHGSMSAGDLANASALTTGAITAVVDRLERAGYAQRVADPADRRRVLVEPTAKAQQAAMELMAEPMMNLAQPFAARYSDDELRLVIEYMRGSRELQERHAEWLRARLEATREQSPARPRARERPRRA